MKKEEIIERYGEDEYKRRLEQNKPRRNKWMKEHAEEEKVRKAKAYLTDKAKVIKRVAKWSKDNPLRRKEIRDKWAKDNPTKVTEARIKWEKEHPLSRHMRNGRSHAKRRHELGYNELLPVKEGEVAHHVTNEDVLGIPELIHQQLSGHSRKKHRTIVLMWLKKNEKRKYNLALCVLAKQ